MKLLARIALFSGFTSASAMAQWTAVSLHPVGASDSYAYGTAGDRQGGYANMGGQFHAGVWSGTAASWVDMHPLTVTSSRVLGMHSGSQVGYTAIGSAVRAAMWSGSAGSWIDLNPTGGIAGFFIVGYANMIDPVTSHAALWTGTASSFLDLNPAAATASYCYGVGAGQQVGYAHIGGQQHASLWSGTAASWVDLNPPGMTSRAYGCQTDNRWGTPLRPGAPRTRRCGIARPNRGWTCTRSYRSDIRGLTPRASGVMGVSPISPGTPRTRQSTLFTLSCGRNPMPATEIVTPPPQRLC